MGVEFPPRANAECEGVIECDERFEERFDVRFDCIEPIPPMYIEDMADEGDMNCDVIPLMGDI